MCVYMYVCMSIYIYVYAHAHTFISDAVRTSDSRAYPGPVNPNSSLAAAAYLITPMYFLFGSFIVVLNPQNPKSLQNEASG